MDRFLIVRLPQKAIISLVGFALIFKYFCRKKSQQVLENAALQLRDFSTVFINNYSIFYGILKPKISFEKIILSLIKVSQAKNKIFCANL